MKSTRSAPTLAAVLIFLLPPYPAKADLGIVRAREVRGSFVITMFTSSELVRGRATDVSVMVQKRDSNEAILDATVSFVLTPPRGSILDRTDPMCGLPTPMALGPTLGSQDGPAIIRARREQSLNKLLYAAPINLPLAGPWKLEALIRHGADAAKLTCEIPVNLPARRFIGLVPYLTLPLLAVTVFAMNQWLRTRYSMK
jgi:hypothetical protein